MLIIKNNEILAFFIDGNIGQDFYSWFTPPHESGLAWWIIDPVNGQAFVDSDGQPYDSVDAWVSVVMAYYYDIKAQLQAATTIDEISTIQAAVDLAGRYGTTGTVLAVPDVHLGDFYN